MPLPNPFAHLLWQHARLLEITTALPEAALLAERFSGREAVNELIRFEIDCISSALNETGPCALIQNSGGPQPNAAIANCRY